MTSTADSYTLGQDGILLRNLRCAMYKLALQPMEMRVTSLTTVRDLVCLSTIGQGCHIFQVKENGIIEKRSVVGGEKDGDKNSCNCYEVQAAGDTLVYIQEKDGSQSSVQIHSIEDILSDKTESSHSIPIQRKAPMVLVEDLKLLALGGGAWSSSWTKSTTDSDEHLPDCEENDLRVLSLPRGDIYRQWQAVDHSVSGLRTQTTATHSMLGVSDSRNGLKVYDLRHTTDSAFQCLYQVPVDEIRDFQLVGSFVAVFHKFEPNVTFWNINEQRTILCINIQDQMKELAEQFLDDEDEDCGLYGDDDDHVTSVTAVPSDDGDYILIYGTKSGCIFGMSVEKRSKLFNVPCPHQDQQEQSLRREVVGVGFVPQGSIVAAYDKVGLTVMDFSPDNPPDRPPTRGQKRT